MVNWLSEVITSEEESFNVSVLLSAYWNIWPIWSQIGKENFLEILLKAGVMEVTIKMMHKLWFF